jgi:hypothetical protein
LQALSGHPPIPTAQSPLIKCYLTSAASSINKETYLPRNQRPQTQYAISCRNPWWCFPFEAIEALAVHLMWIAAATYCAVLAPKTLLATLIGVLGMAHFSLGNTINYALVQCFPNIFGHGTQFNLVNIYRTYVCSSLICHIQVSATRSISNQMKGSYKNSYTNITLNCEQLC